MFRRSVDDAVIVVGHCGGSGSRGAVSNDKDADGSVIATPLIILRYWGFFICANVLLSAVCARPNVSSLG